MTETEKIIKVASDTEDDAFKDPNANIADQVKTVISANPIVVFSKKTCPFCLEVQQTFTSLNVPFTTYDVTTMGRGGEVHAALKTLTKQTTVPYVFINKEFIGGCDATKKLQSEGELQTKLLALGLLKPPTVVVNATAVHEADHVIHHDAAALDVAVRVTGKAAVNAKRASGTLFGFPNTVDDRSARLNGVLCFFVCLFVAIFFRRGAAHWTMVGTLVDFVLRFLFGQSPIAALSQLILAVMELFGSKPKWISGPPKQFAALCGVMFSGLASFFFLTMEHEKNLEYVGLAFTCGLAMACALEGFLGFCLGCFFFSIMIDLGLMPADVYTVHLNSQYEVAYTWNEMNKVLGEGPPAEHTKHIDPENPTVVDFHYKAKTDDMTREDFHPIKHVKITHWAMHMGCVGLAAAWKFAAQRYTLNTSDTVWHVLGVVAAVWYGLFAVLYLAKVFLYFPKVLKEWTCPMRGNSFAAPFICLVLYAYLIETWTHKFAVVLFWAGAGPTMLLSITKVGDWIALRHDLDHVDASWMIMPVGNFVAAFVGPRLDKGFTNTMQFFYAFAFVLFVLLLAVTFYKGILYTENDDRRRPLLTIWIAASAVAAMAYLSCFPVKGGGDFIFLNLYWFSIALSLVFLWCCLRPYFCRIKFDMSYWAAGFPLAVLSVSSMAYASMVKGKLSHAIAITTLAAASALVGTLLLNTLAGLLRRKVFVPEYKWGPVSFMRLTHEAIREAATDMLGVLRALNNLVVNNSSTDAAGSGDTISMPVTNGSDIKGDKQLDRRAAAALLMSLAKKWSDLDFVHKVHSFQEDTVIFKAVEDYFPGVADQISAEHSEFHPVSEQVNSLVEELLGACADSNKAFRAGAWAELSQHVRGALKELLEHLRHEEDHIQPVPRKYLPVAVHKKIAGDVWTSTPATAWFKFLPWVVNNLPMMQQRVRFLKTFLWAMPERAQQMGVMLAAGTEPTIWRLVTDELPELIPRGAPGWRRYY